MKNKLFTLAAALTLAAVIGGIYAAPALAAVIKAALVQSVDEPGRQPFSFKYILTSGNTPGTYAVLPPVPAGKRLILQFNSFIANTNGGFLQISGANGPGKDIYTPIVPISAVRGIATGQAIAYLDSTQSLEVYLLSTPAAAQGEGTLSGYYIDCSPTTACTPFVP